MTMLSAGMLLILSASPLFNASETEWDGLLKNYQTLHPVFKERLTEIAADLKGTPYADGPLGEGSDGIYDQDPLMDLSRVDCVTYIEQCVALAASASYQEAYDTLQKIRYKNSLHDFEHRNHFMVRDWLAWNTWCKEVPLGTVPLTRTISKRDFFKLVKAPDLGRDFPDESHTINYIPVDAVAEIMDKLPTPSLVVFIGKIDWLFALHTGLLIKNPETGLKQLIHASSKGEKVVEVDLTDYVDSQSRRYLGIMLYEIKAPKWEEIPQE